MLDAAVRLVPDDVWEADLLQAVDAAVLVSATMLHDLAMHLREPGFVALVQGGACPVPCPWFSEDHVGRPADAPWPELWASFQREARHFGTSQIELILGTAARRVPGVAYEEHLRPERWTDADRLLIGEFLRRHHARLAHEIARYGVPSATAAEFPVLAESLSPQIADAIGVTARSHGEPLRRMVEYLEYLEPGSKRPAGALLHFHMGLLRAADYLQIEANRAPPLLLRLKEPQSPLSIEEWDKHGAVSAVSWEHRDPLSIFVSVTPQHGLRTHLALRALLDDLQQELDTAAAVLSEVYVAKDLAPLRLARQRVLSNLDEPSLHAQLPYVPQRASLRSDPDLFRLVVRDLYGNQPVVAGRELIQNAVDAVRARRSWERLHGQCLADLRVLDADVVVTLEEHDDDICVLRVEDRGIGMTPDIVIDYYLQAGASFGPTLAELESMDKAEAVSAMKAGRFGVGVFAAFLLGSEVHVETRRAGEERGASFRARLDEELVQIDWAKTPVGTEVSIRFPRSVIPSRQRYGYNEPGSPVELLADIARFYRLRDPVVHFVHERGAERTKLLGPSDVPLPGGRLPDRWRSVPSTGMDAVLWRVPRRDRYGEGELTAMKGGLVAHNGIVIREPQRSTFGDEEAYVWSDATLRAILRRPGVAVFDSRHLLGVALHRYGLVEQNLPFERLLLESIGSDIVAHALVEERSHPLQNELGFSAVYSRDGWMPLLPGLLPRFLRGPLLVLWGVDHAPYWALDRSPDVTTFTARRGPVPWRRFRHRVKIQVDSFHADEHDPDELQRWGHPLDAVEQSARRWADVLRGDALATVVVRGRRKPPRGRLVEAESWYGESGWRSYGGASVEGEPGVFLAGEEAGDAPLERAMVEAACALAAHGPWPAVALSAIGWLASDGSTHDDVASAWIDIVGGSRERGPRRRSQQADAILSAHSHLAPLVRKWERLLDDES